MKRRGIGRRTRKNAFTIMGQVGGGSPKGNLSTNITVQCAASDTFHRKRSHSVVSPDLKVNQGLLGSQQASRRKRRRLIIGGGEDEPMDLDGVASGDVQMTVAQIHAGTTCKLGILDNPDIDMEDLTVNEPVQREHAQARELEDSIQQVHLRREKAFLESNIHAANTTLDQFREQVRSLATAISILAKTRTGIRYSPFVMEPDSTLDALLHSALTINDDLFASPLSTPPSTRSYSPHPFEHDLSSAPHLQPLLPVEDMKAPTKRSRRRKKPANGDGSTEENNPHPPKRPRIDAALDVVQESKKQQRSGHANRARKRDATLSSMFPNSRSLPALASAHTTRHVVSAVKAQDDDGNGRNDVATEDLRSKAASTGYIGNPRCSLPEQREYRLEDLVDDGAHNFVLVKHKEKYTPLLCFALPISYL
ncbi:hypothetical protein AAF712_009722 [Marasmius tenuissimus]|uniref:Shugoshin C-terminal domain-containing protein n=1 Tax=Marasmius tenuissimus TaxID=585030 RepID=A0ABR2ZPT0_9AGAR